MRENGAVAQGDPIQELVDRLNDDDRARVATSIGLPADTSVAQLAKALGPFAKAALAEYLDLFSGRRVPGRIADQEQNRLLYLAEHAFDGRLPDPDIVADMFQKTSAAAKTLVRNTATRFRHELKVSMDGAVWAVMLRARGDGDDWVVEIRDLAMVEHIHELIRRGPGNPQGMKASSGELHVYELDAETMETLLAAIGKSLQEFEAAR